jgi:hypothetical protein
MWREETHSRRTFVEKAQGLLQAGGGLLARAHKEYAALGVLAEPDVSGGHLRVQQVSAQRHPQDESEYQSVGQSASQSLRQAGSQAGAILKGGVW